MAWDGRIRGDARHLPLANESVHCVVSSPPYWGLRKYKIPPTVWDGDPACAHTWGDPEVSDRRSPRSDEVEVAGSSDGVVSRGPRPRSETAGTFCKCGAWLGCYGLEPTLSLYLQHTVEIFQEVHRVLRNDGTLWLNLGDSYAGPASAQQGLNGQRATRRFTARTIPKTGDGLKPKDLVGIPWRVALALQEDGWYLRSDIVWHKPQCMPESVTDRPTRSHEFIFLMTKNEHYFYDNEAIKEPASPDTHARYSRARSGNSQYPGNQTIAKTFEHMKQREPGVNPKAAAAGSGIRNNDSFSAAVKDTVGMRNKRTVWTVPSAAYSEAHYATFPPDLIIPCIKAGTSEKGCCSACGAPWTRLTEPSPEYKKYLGKSWHDHDADIEQGFAQVRGENRQNKMRDETGTHSADYVTVGWKPGCECNTGIVPCTVFDPFLGSGTVGMVADSLGLRWVGTDLGYQDQQAKRLKSVQKEMLFT